MRQANPSIGPDALRAIIADLRADVERMEQVFSVYPDECWERLCAYDTRLGKWVVAMGASQVAFGHAMLWRLRSDLYHYPINSVPPRFHHISHLCEELLAALE